YRKVEGSSAEQKLEGVLYLVDGSTPLDGEWEQANHGWMEPLVPPTGGEGWLKMPPVADVFPWQQPGCKFGRLWPIAPTARVLHSRWHRFVDAPEAERPKLFYTGTSGRNIYTNVRGMRRLVDEEPGADSQPIQRYGYRSFDRQWAFNDPRMAKTESPSLWVSQSPWQIFLVVPMTKETSSGPCCTATPYVPDLDHFRGSFGGKDILPLYRDAGANTPNITRGLLPILARSLSIPSPTPEDLAAYLYTLLSALRYQERFAEALRTPGPRVPMTRDPALWAKAVALGKRLLWLHTYTERLRDPEEGRGEALPVVPGLFWSDPVTQMPDKPSSIKYDAKKQVLTVGNGKVSGVRPEVWNYSVSGMQVVKKWLGYRTARGAGRAASSKNPLDRIRLTTWPDEWSRELIELLTVLTITMELQPEQAALLDAICDGPLIPADELPKPTAAERKEPKVSKTRGPTLF
ncbi:MAG: hypothetical protein H6741_33020, partial [Alphaproteobacteria bacterium]|nr:hypothetical protein [Alphaproteobacteria bacterium]